jgi:hypothetical protein
MADPLQNPLLQQLAGSMAAQAAPLQTTPPPISQVAGLQSLQTPSSAAPPPMMKPPSTIPSVPPIGADKTTAGPSGPAMPTLPAPTAPSIAAPRGTVQGDEAEQGRLLRTGSGISQIHSKIENSDFGQAHPVLGKLLGWGAEIPAMIGDAAGSEVAPALTAAMRGTEYHHDRLLKQANSQVAQDTANQEKQAQTAETQARTGQIENPADEITPLATDNGFINVSKKTGQATPLTVNGEQAQPVEKQQNQAQNVHVLPSGEVVAITRDPATGKSSAEVVYHGTPTQKTEVKQIEVGGKPHQVLIDSASGQTIKDLGETGEKPPVVNVNAGTAALDRESSRFAKAHEKAVTDANSQLDKIADARAMINGNAESQALGVPKVLTALVSGAGSGVRITQPELNAIAKARGIQGNFEGWMNQMQGKGSLTKQQQQQLTGVLDDARTRISQKQAIANEALDTINGAGSRDEIVNADKTARQKLSDMEKSGGSTPKEGESKVNSHGDKLIYKGGKWQLQ